MKRLVAPAAIALTLAAHAASAQGPYAGFETRSIKALSEEQVADLRAGRGMGLAFAAELNGYPGPLHVPELADALQLSQPQRAKMEALFAAMKAVTIALGEKLIAAETELDRQFAVKTVTEVALVTATQAIGAVQAALRAAHLEHHLLAAQVLTAGQIDRYAELRGYWGGPQTGHLHSGHRH